MRLYERDYTKEPTDEEWKEYFQIKKTEDRGRGFGKRNRYTEYPIAVHRYESLFPNNHIDINDLRKTTDLFGLNDAFSILIHQDTTTERDILRFINHDQAYHIIASVFSQAGLMVGHMEHDFYNGEFCFGHHSSNYLFPEFPVGGGKYIADYLLIGSGSGGHEFIFIELEAVNGRTTIKSGDYGEAIRKGRNQISDWMYSIDNDFASITKEFEKYTGNKDLPDEFIRYDPSRFHYIAVAGLRNDYTDKTYWLRRRKEGGIVTLHYDNLYEGAMRLLSSNTF